MRKEMILMLQNTAIDAEEFFESLPDALKTRSYNVAKQTLWLIKKAIQDGLCEEDELSVPLEELYHTVLYYDIGMTLIPERLYVKRDDLSVAERKVIERHTGYGGKILEKCRDSHPLSPEKYLFWTAAADIAVTHHERWDGKGYPFGLVATAIPIISRAAAIADSYEAIVRGSSFRIPLPHEYALLEIKENSGFQFDPDLAAIFIANAKEKAPTLQAL